MISRLWYLLAVPLVGGCATLVKLGNAAKAAAPSASARAPIGIVAHGFSQLDAQVVLAMGAGTVRLSWYGDNMLLVTQLAIARMNGLRVILVAQAPISQGFASLVQSTGADVRVQLLNEPANPAQYAAAFRLAAMAWPQLRLLPAGMSNNVNAAQLRAAIASGLGDTGVICLHVYGTPLVNAVADRLAMARAAGWTGAIIFTELGTKTPADLGPALAAIPASIPTFIYSLNDVEGFALNAYDIATIRAYTLGR